MLVSTTLTLQEKRRLLEEIQNKLSVYISSTKPSNVGSSKYLWFQILDRAIIDRPDDDDDDPTKVEGVLLDTSVYNPEVYAYALALEGEQLLSIENAIDDISRLDNTNILIQTVE